MHVMAQTLSVWRCARRYLALHGLKLFRMQSLAVQVLMQTLRDTMLLRMQGFVNPLLVLHHTARKNTTSTGRRARLVPVPVVGL